MDFKHIVVFITVSSKQEADTIANALVSEHVAACVNQVPAVNSVFWWQGKLDSAAEILLVVKSSAVLLPKIIERVKALHSYTVPEIIALPIVGGNREYLDWIDESIR
jgi:periplasmic divalent cation tolerance protein